MRIVRNLLWGSQLVILGCRALDEGILTEPPDGSHCRAPEPDWCEQTCVDVLSDLDHCGGCGLGCAAPPNAESAVCSGGECLVNECQQGFDNCDGNDDNGCEADLRTSASHCGSCGVACATECSEGACDDPIEVSAGPFYTCALRASGAVWCWGNNAWGAVGAGKPIAYPEPVRVELPGPAVAVHAGRSASRQHTCALLADETVRCWGANASGQLGTGDKLDSSTPLPVPLRGVEQVVTGGVHTCAVLKTHELFCWGSNGSGQLGLSDVENPLLPALVLKNVLRVAAGDSHTCVRRLNATIWCWGANDAGQVGSGSPAATLGKPTPVPGAEEAVALALGAAHSCALFEDGSVKCWGDGTLGQLGLGTIENATTPQPVRELPSATLLAVGLASSAAIVGDTVFAWGANEDAQLGTGDTAPALAPVPTKIGPVRRLALGAKHGCAIRTSGELVCWGANGFGQLGNGTEEPSAVPVPVVFPVEVP